MAITTAMCTSFKSELARALHNFTITTGNVFKCALFISAPAGTFGAASTNYSEMGVDELATAGGYTRPGFAWTAAQNLTPATTGTTAFWSWSVNPSWTSATFSTRGCMIYNSSATDRAVAVFDFGGIQTVAAGTFTVTLPTNDSTSAILRIA